jgi:tetratricopeptide (TPR) repeat protein
VPELGGRGTDPLRLAPFTRLWKDGKGSVKLAALAECATGKDCASEHLIELEAAVKKSSEKAIPLSHALVVAYDNLERRDEALRIARHLRKMVPDSKVARNLELALLWQLERYAEYARLVRQELRQDNDDPVLLRSLGDAEEALGHLAKAEDAYERALEEASEKSSLHNQIAWNRLFHAKVDEEALNHALQAVQLSGFRSTSALHTLACVYAEIGKTEEARQTLDQVLELRAGGNPATVDWLIVGRLAEQYGLPDAARDAYRRVEKPAKSRPKHEPWHRPEPTETPSMSPRASSSLSWSVLAQWRTSSRTSFEFVAVVHRV